MNKKQGLINMNVKLIIVCIIMGMHNLVYADQYQENRLAHEVRVSLNATEIGLVSQKMDSSNQKQQQIWIDTMSNRMEKWVSNELVRKKLLTIIKYESTRSGLDPQLVLSIITIESGFNKYAISQAGALGFMQIMPFWLKKIGSKNQSLLDAQTNIRYGCSILKHYLELEHGNLYNALGRYNGSRGDHTYPDLVLNAYNKYWQT